MLTKPTVVIILLFHNTVDPWTTCGRTVGPLTRRIFFFFFFSKYSCAFTSEVLPLDSTEDQKQYFHIPNHVFLIADWKYCFQSVVGWIRRCKGPTVDWKVTCSPGWCGSVVECWPVNQRVTGPIPMPGLWARSSVGGEWEATSHWCFSLSLSLPLSKK